MRIERIRIQGYRSLADLELRPGDFTVLVGPNNSGKSNIVDALDFVSDIYRVGAKLAIDKKGGFENLSHRSKGEPGIRIDFDIEGTASVWEILGTGYLVQTGDDMKPVIAENRHLLRIQHSFSLVGDGKPLISDFRITNESIQIDRLVGENTSLLRLTRHGSNTQFDVTRDETLRELVFTFASADNNDVAAGLFGPTVSNRDLMSSRLQLFSPTSELFADHLSRLQMFRLVPLECRRPAAPTSVAQLGVHGENLPALVFHLQDQFPVIWSTVMQRMSQIVPELQRIDVRSTGDRLWTLMFSEFGSASPWSASEVSDGTIRALALFASMYDPRNSLLAMEEPENSVHPWILRVFVEICREVAAPNSGKQVIVTTHSPVLIDQLEPSEVAVVWKDQGQTKVTPLIELDKNASRNWEEGRASLFDLLDSGLLRQAVPSA